YMEALAVGDKNASSYLSFYLNKENAQCLLSPDFNYPSVYYYEGTVEQNSKERTCKHQEAITSGDINSGKWTKLDTKPCAMQQPQSIVQSLQQQFERRKRAADKAIQNNTAAATTVSSVSGSELETTGYSAFQPTIPVTGIYLLIITIEPLTGMCCIAT